MQPYLLGQVDSFVNNWIPVFHFLLLICFATKCLCILVHLALWLHRTSMLPVEDYLRGTQWVYYFRLLKVPGKILLSRKGAEPAAPSVSSPAVSPYRKDVDEEAGISPNVSGAASASTIKVDPLISLATERV